MEKCSHCASYSQRPSPIDIKIENIKEEDLPPLNNPFENSEFDNDPVECINDGMTSKFHSDIYYLAFYSSRSP